MVCGDGGEYGENAGNGNDNDGDGGNYSDGDGHGPDNHDMALNCC